MAKRLPHYIVLRAGKYYLDFTLRGIHVTKGPFSDPSGAEVAKILAESEILNGLYHKKTKDL